jgi:hypothetical protein
MLYLIHKKLIELKERKVQALKLSTVYHDLI